MENISELEKLVELYKAGSITKAEFEQLKAEIITSSSVSSFEKKQFSSTSIKQEATKGKRYMNYFIVMIIVLLFCTFLYWDFNKESFDITKLRQVFQGKENTSRAYKDEEALTFQGQTLKKGEHIIKVQWGMETVGEITEFGSIHQRYISKNMIVPRGKKWVLLYASETVWFYGGGMGGLLIPRIFINSKDAGSISEDFADSSSIQLSRAKDKWLKIYSNSTVCCVSVATPSNTFIKYRGDIWFLEMDE